MRQRLKVAQVALWCAQQRAWEKAEKLNRAASVKTEKAEKAEKAWAKASEKAEKAN